MEYQAKYLHYSKKQHLFLVVYEFSGAENEVVLYWENTAIETVSSKSSTVKGKSAVGCIHFLLSAIAWLCLIYN